MTDASRFAAYGALRYGPERLRRLKRLRRRHTLAEIAAREGVSRQRIHQLLKVKVLKHG